MIRACVICGQEFEAKLSRMLLCSDECRREREKKQAHARWLVHRDRIRAIEEAGRKLRKEWHEGR
jgi:hypothetical protein